jgi:hypothetical protein
MAEIGVDSDLTARNVSSRVERLSESRASVRSTTLDHICAELIGMLRG